MAKLNKHRIRFQQAKSLKRARRFKKYTKPHLGARVPRVTILITIQTPLS